MKRTTLLLVSILLLAVCGIAAGDSSRYNSQTKEPVRMAPEERAQLTELRKELTERVNAIARIVARDLGSQKYTSPTKFTVEVDNSGDAATIHIQMDDIVVVGDGNGCAQDPPGVSCECPCP